MCYFVICVNSANISWNDASVKCDSIGGHLPFIKLTKDLLILNPDTYFYINFNEHNDLSGMGDLTFLGLYKKVRNRENMSFSCSL